MWAARIAPLSALIGSPPAGRRVAVGNLAMRLAVALPFLFLLAPVLALLQMVSASPGQLVLNFHTAFNIVASLLFLPFAGLVAKAVTRLIPDQPVAVDSAKPRHLDPNVIDTPSEALACAMRETLHMGDRVADMLRQALVVFEKSDPKLVKEVEKADNAVDDLHEAIKLYLVKVSKAEMTEEESRRYVEILTFTTNLEHVGDIIDKNLMELATKKIKNRYTFSPEGLEEIRRFHARVMDNMRLAFNVFATRDVTLARRLLAEKATTRAAELAAADSHFARLREGRPESIETSAIHLDVMRDLKRINGHLTSVAYPILEVAGELRDSRLREREAAQASGAGAERQAGRHVILWRMIFSKRYCNLIRMMPATIITAAMMRGRLQRLLQDDHRDGGAEQHAGLAQRRDERDRRDRHRPDRDPVGGERERAADQPRLPEAREIAKHSGPAPRQHEDEHHQAVEQKEPHRIGMRVAGNARADAVDDRIGADRHRGEQREADRAPVEMHVAPAAQREQEHAADQDQDAEPAAQADRLADQHVCRRWRSSAARCRARSDRPAPCRRCGRPR